METPNKDNEDAATESSIEYAAPEGINWSGLKMRVISSLVMATIAMFCLLAGGMWFIVLVILASVEMVREWDNLTRGQGRWWQNGAYVYVTLPAGTLIWLRGMEFTHEPNAGMLMVLYLLLVVWATDIGAYFAGKKIGGPKLAPTISPGKTWAGLAGGVAAAAVVGAIGASFTPYPANMPTALFTGIFLALVAQAGDLFESWIKRRAGVKDAGEFIPGHGGILDRVDGLIFAAPIYGLMVALAGMQ